MGVAKLHGNTGSVVIGGASPPNSGPACSTSHKGRRKLRTGACRGVSARKGGPHVSDPGSIAQVHEDPDIVRRQCLCGFVPRLVPWQLPLQTLGPLDEALLVGDQIHPQHSVVPRTLCRYLGEMARRR